MRGGETTGEKISIFVRLCFTILNLFCAVNRKWNIFGSFPCGKNSEKRGKIRRVGRGERERGTSGRMTELQ